MKNLFFVLFLMIAAVATTNAQCAKTASTSGAACCAKKGTAAATTDVNATFASAEEAAKADESIMERVCAQSGAKTYYQKNASAEGTVTWDEVTFCSESKRFKKVAAASAERTVEEAQKKADKASCSPKADGKACCSKGAAKTSCAGKEQ